VVQRDAARPRLAAGFALTSGPGPIEALASSGAAVEACVARLTTAGHLVAGPGGLRPSAGATAALGGPGGVSFGVTHTEVVDGQARSASLQAFRLGARTVVFRVATPAGAPPRYEWAEVTRQELRELVAVLVMPHEARDTLVNGTPAPTTPAPEPLEPPAPAPAPVSAAAPPPPSPPARWAPTHRVPAGGLPARAAPDANLQPSAQLAAGVLLRVGRRAGDWAEVEGENGWRGWVDGRRLEAGAESPAPAPAPQAWAPTHRVPRSGLPARTAPDASLPAIATLGAGTPLRVAEERGAWALVTAENGWRGWVDGRRLEPL
jgi:hypothetical protein